MSYFILIVKLLSCVLFMYVCYIVHIDGNDTHTTDMSTETIIQYYIFDYPSTLLNTKEYGCVILGQGKVGTPPPASSNRIT
jgi:hypothetical protein